MRKMFFCLHLRQSYEDHNGEIINIWNAYDNAPTPQDKYNIFIYSWLLHNGGVIMSPKLIPKISLFLITNKENIKRKALSVFFSDNGYFDNDLILSTPNANLIKAILYFITQNVNKNQLSSPIHKKVHLLDDTLTGKFAVRKSFLDFIQNPSFEISNEGFRTETISCLSQNHKSKIVTENKTYYYNCKILNFITIDYPEFINNTISNDDIKNNDNNVISNVDDKKDNNLDKNIIHQ